MTDSRGVQVSVLGPFEVTVDGRPVQLRAGRLRALLAVLAMSAGRAVPVDQIVTALWNADEPGSGRRAAQTYISRVRTALGTVDITAEATGYVLRLEPDRVDALRFLRLLDTAERNGNPAEERALLDEALQLWRGVPFEGVQCDRLARVEAPRLVERRLAAVERRVDLRLADRGDDGSAELVAQLRGLAEEHPLRETLWVRLLAVLRRGGRHAEALDLYGLVRARLGEELGTDPGPQLQRIHAALLAGGPEPDDRPAPDGQRPRQLPAPPRMFTGRLTELAQLQRARDTSTVVISAIDGMAGIGKTALAVQAAHRLADRYPDGQLFVDLHGYTEGMPPTDPAEALGHLLGALGVAGTRIPPGLAQRSGLYRTRLAGRRVLVVLDNAATEQQVQPLLPGTAGCLVLVTSRRRLAGLDETLTVSLGTLPPDDAVHLFVRTAGEERVADQPAELIEEVVELCGRLPLAIRIAAARLRSHAAWDVAHLVRRLRDQQHRLGELAAGHRSVTAALELSYRHLSTGDRRAYRLLGLHPGPDIDTDAAAALIGTTSAGAGPVLDRLIEARLLLEPVAGRYRFHDLIRAHAAHAVTTAIATVETGPALDRLLDHYRHAAAQAMDAAYPYEADRRPAVSPSPVARTRPDRVGAGQAGGVRRPVHGRAGDRPAAGAAGRRTVRADLPGRHPPPGRPARPGHRPAPATATAGPAHRRPQLRVRSPAGPGPAAVARP
jgi:DNA-binding SARP family transcriptional activator